MALRKPKPIYYWDTCIFIALLSKEDRPNNEMQGVRAIRDANNKNENIIITSTITGLEIFKDNNVNDLYKNLLKRSSIGEISLDNKIRDKAAKLQQQILALYKNEKKQLNPMDSIHLATAIIHRVRAFHTFDEKDHKSGKPNIQWLGLLQLNGKEVVDGLRIEKPPVGQYSFDFSI